MNNLAPKQVIVIRKDLNMRKGKIAAQASHASIGAIFNYGKYQPEVEGKYASFNISLQYNPLNDWLNGQFTKVCVYVNSEQELLDIYEKAMYNTVNVKLITDLGLTEFDGVPTLTCLAIGPDYSDVIDPITGHLPLL